MNCATARRVLVVDVMPSIHEDFRKILVPADTTRELDGIEAALFGDSLPDAALPEVELASAFQGREALAMVVAARQAGRPFALAFVDMRMPPGWDGVETIEQLWRIEPGLRVVICTAYSDHPMEEVLRRLEGKGRPLILAKPFDPVQVRRLVGPAA